MSARHANRRKSNCCDSVGCRAIGIHSCQREIERGDSLAADFRRRGSFAVGRGRVLRFGFAIGRPNGIASRPIERRISTRILTNETKRTGRIDDASVLASRAPLLVAQRATGPLATGQLATVHSPAPRERINFFEVIYFRFGASGRLSTAMIDASQRLIESDGAESTGDVDRASDCAGVSGRSNISRDATRSGGAPSASHPTERAA
jgi:hypothetical protein